MCTHTLVQHTHTHSFRDRKSIRMAYQKQGHRRVVLKHVPHPSTRGAITQRLTLAPVSSQTISFSHRLHFYLLTSSAGDRTHTLIRSRQPARWHRSLNPSRLRNGAKIRRNYNRGAKTKDPQEQHAGSKNGRPQKTSEIPASRSGHSPPSLFREVIGA